MSNLSTILCAKILKPTCNLAVRGRYQDQPYVINLVILCMIHNGKAAFYLVGKSCG